MVHKLVMLPISSGQRYQMVYKLVMMLPILSGQRYQMVHKLVILPILSG